MTELETLVTSIRQLFAGIRGARTACWATLTCTVLSVREQQAAEMTCEEKSGNDDVAQAAHDEKQCEEGGEKKEEEK